MFSYSVIIQQNVEVFKVLYIIMHFLGATFDDLNSTTAKYFTNLYSFIVLLFYVTQFLVCTVFIFPQINISAPFAAFCVFKLCETMIPIIVTVQSFYSGRAYLKSCIDDIIFTDKILHSTGIEVGYVKMKRIVKLTFICTGMCVFFVLGTILFLSVHTSKRFGILGTIGLCFLETYNSLYNVCLNYFFCLVLLIFQQRFKELNENIKCLTGPKHEEGIRFITVKPYNSYNTTLEKIKTVKFVHAIYRQIVLDHNNRFGFVAVLQYTQIGTVFIFCIYYLVSIFSNTESIKDPSVIGITFVTMLRGSSLLLSAIVSCVASSSEVCIYYILYPSNTHM